jgi:Domain of unknown function (DUF4124)
MCSVAIALACATAFAATTVYKWVDEQGVTHYSDQPHPHAQTINVDAAQTYSAPAAEQVGAAPSPSSAQPAPPYQECDLFRPENDEVFLNTDTVTARLRLEPPLRPGDRVAIGLDGRRLKDQPATGSEFTLKVERGTHTLLAVIEDSSAKPVCTSPTITFHVRQPSVQAPNRANRPRF